MRRADSTRHEVAAQLPNFNEGKNLGGAGKSGERSDTGTDVANSASPLALAPGPGPGPGPNQTTPNQMCLYPTTFRVSDITLCIAG